jgi:hypothetical protein
MDHGAEGNDSPAAQPSSARRQLLLWIPAKDFDRFLFTSVELSSAARQQAIQEAREHYPTGIEVRVEDSRIHELGIDLAQLTGEPQRPAERRIPIEHVHQAFSRAEADGWVTPDSWMLKADGVVRMAVQLLDLPQRREHADREEAARARQAAAQSHERIASPMMGEGQDAVTVLRRLAYGE